MDSNSCCCVLSMARELASIGRLLTKKYALTERDENLDRFCSKAFFDHSVLEIFGHFVNDDFGKFFWYLYFLISVFRL